MPFWKQINSVVAYLSAGFSAAELCNQSAVPANCWTLPTRFSTHVFHLREDDLIQVNTIVKEKLFWKLFEWNWLLYFVVESWDNKTTADSSRYRQLWSHWYLMFITNIPFSHTSVKTFFF